MGFGKVQRGYPRRDNVEGGPMTDPNPIYTQLLAERGEYADPHDEEQPDPQPAG
jgi:hypothetical protein